jgi:glycosyltransferase involved in cell wall biosynthesis
MPRVSVIVPAYNAASTIEPALASVLAQKYDDWEIVVADDGSTDDTQARAQRASPRVRVVGSPENVGLPAARNLAIAHAQGELLALLDADDLWLPDYLESQVGAYDAAQRRWGDVGVVACDAYLQDETGRRLEGTYRTHAPFPHRFTMEALLNANVIFVGALTPRHVVESAGGFDPRTFGCSDHDLWIRIVEQGWRVVDNPHVLAVYRVLSGSVSARRGDMATTTRTTFQLALERGRLTPRQRRIARRQVRVAGAVERLERALPVLRQRRSAGALLQVTRSVLTFIGVAASRPGQWPRWARSLGTGHATVWRSRLR